MPGNEVEKGERKLTCLIGLDIGTSAIKGILMSTEGAIIAREKQETRYQTFADGRIQFDAQEMYALAADVIRRLAGALPEDAFAAGLSIASASGNTVLANDAGVPMLPAFSWMDARVVDEIESVFGKLDANEVHERVGWPLISLFPLAHLSWLKVHKPELLARADRVCMSVDYFNFRLTGVWGIDSSTAATLYLQDQKAGDWHTPYLRKLGISRNKLPPIHPPGTLLGHIVRDAALATGLPVGTPVVLGSFDHPSAARGVGVLQEGQLLISCGTSWVGFYPVRDRSKAIASGLLVDTFLQPAGAWGAMFSLPAIAEAVDRYVCAYISAAPGRYREFDRLAALAQPGAGGLTLNPNLEIASGELNGRSKSDIARAVMEGAAFLLRMQIERLELAGLSVTSVTMVGGPSETLPWPQIVADVLGKELTVINGSSAGAVGAAIMAGIGLGIYADAVDAFRGAAFAKLVKSPNLSAHEALNKVYGEFVAQNF